MHPLPSPEEILQQYWGYPQFRPMQRSIIQCVLDGHDTLAILPTGGGKSLCFQVPALVKPGLCLVVSPLIALMRDQVERLNSLGIPALAIHSGMNGYQVKSSLQLAIRGPYKFLYVSPERLKSQLFQEFVSGLNINSIAVDEAHCISQWGYDFRPAYLEIADLRDSLPDVPVIALTASATPLVQQDIIDRLLMRSGYQRFQQSFSRPNLAYRVKTPEAREPEIEKLLAEYPGTAIIYARSRKHTQQLAEHLQRKNISASFYHAGLSNEERGQRQANWLENRTRVMVCTNAFGMGIDKPDVRLVIHLHPPDCLENYYQEAGRAGRDGKPALAVLITQPDDLIQLQRLPDLRYPTPAYLKQVYFDFMNYLQVPAGYGEGQSYPIDLEAFSTAFNHSPLVVANALKALEQEGLFKINEAGWQPAQVQITADLASLRSLETDFPAFDELVKALLRAYSGILDYPATLHENQLVRLTGLPAEEIQNRLLAMERLGICQYQPASEKPQVWLLLNRMYHDSYQINVSAHLARKKALEDRIRAMLDYLDEREHCRSLLLGQYFGDSSTTRCGICDNCLASTRVKKPTNPVALLLHLLQEQSWQPSDLAAKAPELTPSQWNETIRYLLENGQIRWQEDGRIGLTGKG